MSDDEASSWRLLNFDWAGASGVEMLLHAVNEFGRLGIWFSQCRGLLLKVLYDTLSSKALAGWRNIPSFEWSKILIVLPQIVFKKYLSRFLLQSAYLSTKCNKFRYI